MTSPSILKHAVLMLSEKLHSVRISRIWTTLARHVTDQPDFSNAVLEADDTLEPYVLLDFIHDIETHLGRDRRTEIPKGPRSLDIDILIHGNKILHDPVLTVPHQYMDERRFVLVPLLELSPGLVKPGTDVPYARLLARLRPQGLRLEQSASDILLYP